MLPRRPAPSLAPPRRLLASSAAMAQQVRVEKLVTKEGNAMVVKGQAYSAMVTLSIEAADGSLTPSGWSTRKE